MVREIYFPGVDFIVNGLFYSTITLIVATWRMKVRGLSWKAIGLRLPKNPVKPILITGIILVSIIGSIVAYEVIKEAIPFLADNHSEAIKTDTRFSKLKGNIGYFFLIIGFVWIESMLEEMLDRGFLINWLERVFSKTSVATVLAVLLQAFIFGFRHAPSHGLSGAITVCIIGLIMGIAYVKGGRNLWPLIMAHCILNTISMLERL